MQYNAFYSTVLLNRINHFIFLLGIIISFPLWLNSRVFPLCDLGMTLAPPFDFMQISILIGLVLYSLLRSSNVRVLNLSIFGLTVWILAQDQLRWQPWVYHFLILLLPFIIFNKKIQIIKFIRIVLAATILWGGIHKLNPQFGSVIIPQLTTPVLGKLSKNFELISYLVPLTEIVIGIGLLTNKFRRRSAKAAVLIHLLIAFYFTVVLKFNNIVIVPWNLGLSASFYICFIVNKEKIKLDLSVPSLIGYLFLIVLPCLNLKGKFDAYLSFNLYTGTNELVYIAIEESQMSKIQKKFNITRQGFKEIPGIQGGKIVDLNQWAFSYLHVPIPPEKRIFDQIAKEFCNLDIEEDKLKILKFKQPIADNIYEIIDCRSIE